MPTTGPHEPSITYTGDDGQVLQGAEANAAILAHARRQAERRAAATPRQREALEAFYARRNELYTERTVEKRAQGYGDCTAEMDEANAIAGAEVAARYTDPPKAQRDSNPDGTTRTRTRPARSRERRSHASRSSRASTSGDDGDDSDGPEPASRRPIPVHIAGTPSVESDAAVARFLERFLAIERPGTSWQARPAERGVPDGVDLGAALELDLAPWKLEGTA